MSGKAMLKEASWSRQVLIQEAHARLSADSLYAQAEIIRAHGVAEANTIIGGGIAGNQDYLQYLAIQAQMKMAQSPNHTTVYVPSGANGIPLVRTVEQ
jgi:hypothetical protein